MMATDGRFHGDVEVRSMPVPHCQPNRDPCQEEEDQEQEKKEEKKESQRTVSAAANTAAALVKVEVDVIVPVHNASLTLREAVLSALRQRPRPRTTTTTTRNGRDEGSFDDGDPRQAGSASLPEARQQPEPELEIVVHVCCHDDGSTDDSWKVLQELLVEHLASRDLSNSTSASAATSDDAASSTAAPSPASDDDEWYWESHLLLSKSNDGVSRGAGYARNRAVELRPNLCARRLGNDGSDDNADGSIVDSTKQQQQPERHQFLCMLDSDDVMDECRIVEQVTHIMSLSPSEQQRCLLGCNFVRLPEGSTAHYTEWANSLNDERLGLERFREVTVLQPTWMMTRSRFDELGGYIEAPHPSSFEPVKSIQSLRESSESDRTPPPLIYPDETPQTLRLAEDLRFFHAHLATNGALRKCPGDPLVMYRHHANATSQSASTPRKLLLQLRALAFERYVLERDPSWQGQFAVWGAGRDGKDFCKALSAKARARVCCFADVDDAKIRSGSYVNPQLGLRIPIVHFTYLVRDDETRSTLTAAWREGGGDAHFGRIDKSPRDASPPLLAAVGRSGGQPPANPRKRKLACVQELDLPLLPHLPVVVCVAMYRTGGALESNVKLIGRTEGKDLWHFS